MSRVEIISASAGTGKTTRLAQLIHDAVTEGTARPEAILATTFTRRAAAELAERAREALLQDGKTRAAQRLHAARIGTVNGICGGLVHDFAFLHGLSPRVSVLDEDRAQDEQRRAGFRALPPKLLHKLEDLHLRMGPADSTGPGSRGAWSWQDDVIRIVRLARANAIAPDRFDEFAKRSIASLPRLLDEPEADGQALDRALASELGHFLELVDLDADTTGATKKACDRVRAARARGPGNLRWSEWANLAQLVTGKKSRHLADDLRRAASAHDRHPRLHRDLERAVGAVFEAAGYVIEAYQAHKRKLGVIDFVDQETKALELLRSDAVREQLGDEIDLVLVDEFQDTSPIQLAIFLELSKIARRSVWVGDPKQAIYGFRGADPALMDAAIAALLRDGPPETLGLSYRSRPPLVRLTSALFAPPFAASGIPAELVHIEPGLTDVPEGLGPIFERWLLAPAVDADGKKLRPNIGLDLASLAAGVSELLDDPEVRVRDAATGETRRVRPGDVALLCFKNEECRKLARELEARGVRAVVGRPGLVATLEARLAIAALRLWIDPSDALARAELARWLDFGQDSDAWLTQVLETRDLDALFGDRPAIAALVAAREARRFAGVLASFDAALAAAQVRERAVTFGNATARLANLDALRALAAGYVERCRSEGTPCSLRGLLGVFDQLAGDEADRQAAVERPDAVHVGTLHRAKGLEWPITVLADLSKRPAASALGAHLVPESDRIDLDDLLAGRWLRYWPRPYGSKRKGVPLFDRLEGHPATRRVEDAARRESLRLLYVAWTRARDRLVYAARPERMLEGALQQLSADGRQLVSEPDHSGPLARVAWGLPGEEHELEVRVRKLPPTGAAQPGRAAALGYVPAGPRAHPPATLSASELPGQASVAEPTEIGPRISIAIADDDAMRRFGDAVHAFLAVDRPTFPAAEREALAAELLERFEVSGAVQAKELPPAADRLARWIDSRWPGATWRREWPLLHRLPEGTVLRGVADLVLETDAGLVLLDHKTFPGNRLQAIARAAEHAGQLSAYAAALEAATQKPLLAAYIHLPVSGLAIEVVLQNER